MSRIVELGTTCGVEIESEILTSQNVAELGDLNSWRPTHDASIESDKCLLNNGLIVDLPSGRTSDGRLLRLIPYRNTTVGTELVSVILNSTEDNFFDEIKYVTNGLSTLGEPPQSTRAGIHFHFSLPNPSLSMLKSIIRAGKYFEALFFTIGGMGYEFRGIYNDSTYCRPITKYGPPCVPYRRGEFVQVFNIYDVLKAKTQEEFWNLYGDLRRHGGRYNPIRYTWLNLYPLCPWSDFYRGTLEFRVFNKTLNPQFIYAVGIMCKKFTEYVITSSFDSLKEDDLLHENSVYSDLSKDTLFGNLRTFVEITGTDNSIAEVLFNILDLSPVPTLEKSYVYTHIRTELPNYWRDSGYSPNVIPTSVIKRPEYVDLHVLRGER